MSFEPSRSSAYSEDLRWRMVWQKEALGYTCTKIAENLCVDKSTVSRTLTLFHSTVSQKSHTQKEELFESLPPLHSFLFCNCV